jgi:hypothetical protein
LHFKLKLIAMSTRGNVIVRESAKGAVLVNMYNQMDSYPSGLGQELADFLADRVIVNGISLDPKGPKRISNGIEDLAAQLVCLLKGDSSNAGGVYISRPRLSKDNDYTYVVYPTTVTKIADWAKPPFDYEEPTGEIRITVYSWAKKLFDGTIAEYVAWLEHYKD